MPPLPTTPPSHVAALAAVIVTCLPAHVTAQTLQSFTEPYETVLVAAPEAGIVNSVAVREGDRVAQGQTIASLDNQLLEASLASAQARANAQGKLSAAQTAFDVRQQRYAKFQSLRGKGHASLEEVEKAEADLSIARANLVAAKEEVQQFRLEASRIRAGIARRVIRSPIDGVLLRLHKTAGESVGPSDDQIATIVQLTALRLTLYLPTPHATQLEPDESIPLLFPDSGDRAVGRVEYISPVTDSDSGTVRVVVVIDNPNGNYRSGVPCNLAR